MVSKKKIKRIIKRNKKVKANIKKPIDKDDFEVFKLGIQRLKELKKELDSLDTRGFNKEVQTIRKNLKNVSEIQNIEKNIKILKLKINRKYHPKRRANKSDSIKKEIKKLSEKIDKSSDIRGKIDPELEVLVDKNFKNFLDNIKTALSKKKKVEKKESNIFLKEDLEKQKKDFREKHILLIKELKDKEKILEQMKKNLIAQNIKKGKNIEQMKKNLIAQNIKKGKIFKKDISNEFELKLKKQIEKQKSEIKQRKLDLELEMQKKIKQILS